NAAGEGARGFSDDVILIGASYTVPFFESFALGEFTYPLWWGTRIGDTGFTKEVGSEDRDGGSISWTPYNVSDECWLNSGKISLAGAEHPVLSFSCKCSADAAMALDVVVAENGKEESVLRRIESSSCNGEWQRFVVDLSTYKNAAFVVLKLHATTSVDYKRMSIDRIRIHDLASSNMAVELSPLGQAVCGEEAVYRVKVLNFGEVATDNYTVNLYLGDDKVAEAAGIEVASMDEQWLELAFNAPLEGASIDVVAEVASANDVCADDNRSNIVTTKLVNAEVPAVASLDGQVSSQSVALTWTAPSASTAPKTDGFETYDAWTTDRFGRWTTANGNNGLTFAMSGIHFPLGGHAYAFTIFNPIVLGLNPEYTPQVAPHSGEQFACAMAEYQYNNCDKWMISPRLSGEAQTITFYATALSSSYVEAFAVYYSTDGNSLDNFVNIAAEEGNVEGMWKLYEVTLPAGANYFAIHYESYQGFGFFVDDVTYIPGYQLTGYNVYRNGELLANVPASSTSFTDTEHATGNYTVTACYREGESALSEVYQANEQGVINASTSADYIVRGEQAAVGFCSDSAHNVRIIDATGVVLFTESLCGESLISLVPGIYLVTVDNNIHKVIVR
ncbi:MAG: choice-of-anchor J domain-containing protein, partial [Muribaculaceae bacterium]